MSHGPVASDDLVPDLSGHTLNVSDAADSGLAAIGPEVLLNVDLLGPTVGKLVDDIGLAHDQSEHSIVCAPVWAASNEASRRSSHGSMVHAYGLSWPEAFYTLGMRDIDDSLQRDSVSGRPSRPNWVQELYEQFSPVRQEAERCSEDGVNMVIDAAVRAVRSKPR